MTERSGAIDILEDVNFKKLASCETDGDAFEQLVNAHVSGYTQKRRLVEALKELSQKKEAVDQKLSVQKALGKAKSGKLDEADQVIADSYNSVDLKEKIKMVNNLIQTMIDEGQLTASEKPIALENLKERQAKAKAAEKTALFEKLEGMIKAVTRKAPLALTCASIEDIFAKRQSLDEAQRLEKKALATMTEKERETLRHKPKTEVDLKTLEKSSRMWFESEAEFQQRLDQALADCAANWAERLRLQEEAAFEKKIKDEQDALEAKRLREIEKKDQEAKELMAKLEARRLESMAKPQKAVPKRVVKEKKKAVKLDPNSLFLTPEQMKSLDPGQGEEAEEEEAPAQEEEEAAEEAAEDKAESEVPEVPPKTSLESSPPSPDPSPSLEASPSPEPSMDVPTPPQVKAKVVMENKWTAVVPDTEQQEQCPEDPDAATMAKAAEVAEILAGPSLADALKGPAKSAKKMPPPAKKEKKKAVKVDVSELGFS